MAAARAAHDGTLQIEAALAEAASRTLTVAEVAELRGRLLEEQTAAADAIAARRATATRLRCRNACSSAAKPRRSHNSSSSKSHVVMRGILQAS